MENALRSDRIDRLDGERIPFDQEALISRLPAPVVSVKRTEKTLRRYWPALPRRTSACLYIF